MKRTCYPSPRSVFTSILPIAVCAAIGLPAPRTFAQGAPAGGASAVPVAGASSITSPINSTPPSGTKRDSATTRDVKELAGLLASAKATEEGDANFDQALEEYRALIADFDRGRPIASEALFRSAEVLQKLGRDKEAQAAYRRVVQEFADMPEFRTAYSRVLQAFAEEVKSSRFSALPSNAVNQPGFSLPGEMRPGDPKSAGIPPERYARYGRAGKAVEAGAGIAAGNASAFRSNNAPGADHPPGAQNPLSDREFSEILTVQQELDALRGEARDLAAMRRRIEREMRATNGESLRTLPVRFIEDPHFLQMLEKLQGAREAAATPGLPSAGRTLSETVEALEQLTTDYFKNTYLPRLTKSLNLTMEEFHRLRQEIEQLELKLQELQVAHAKRPKF